MLRELSDRRPLCLVPSLNTNPWRRALDKTTRRKFFCFYFSSLSIIPYETDAIISRYYLVTHCVVLFCTGLCTRNCFLAFAELVKSSFSYLKKIIIINRRSDIQSVVTQKLPDNSNLGCVPILAANVKNL